MASVTVTVSCHSCSLYLNESNSSAVILSVVPKKRFHWPGLDSLLDSAWLQVGSQQQAASLWPCCSYVPWQKASPLIPEVVGSLCWGKKSFHSRKGRGKDSRQTKSLSTTVVWFRNFVIWSRLNLKGWKLDVALAVLWPGHQQGAYGRDESEWPYFGFGGKLLSWGLHVAFGGAMSTWFLDAVVELQCVCRLLSFTKPCAWGILCSFTLSLEPADKPLFDLTVAVFNLASLVSGISLCSWLTYRSLVSIINMAACGIDSDVSGWAFCLKLYIEFSSFMYKVFTVIVAIYLMPGSAKYFMCIIWAAYFCMTNNSKNLRSVTVHPAGTSTTLVLLTSDCSWRPHFHLSMHRG